MNALELLMVVFLTHSCYLADISYTKIGGNNFKVSDYRCTPDVIQVWQRYCDQGAGYWGRPFVVKDATTGSGFYLDKFGGVNASQQVDLEDVRFPACGA